MDTDLMFYGGRKQQGHSLCRAVLLHVEMGAVFFGDLFSCLGILLCGRGFSIGPSVKLKKLYSRSQNERVLFI